MPNTLSLPLGTGGLITGSNMSGKSTFLRTIGVTTIMAQTLNTCLAAEYEAPVFRVRSCIGRSDNLLSGTSYYIAEVEALLEWSLGRVTPIRISSWSTSSFAGRTPLNGSPRPRPFYGNCFVMSRRRLLMLLSQQPTTPNWSICLPASITFIILETRSMPMDSSSITGWNQGERPRETPSHYYGCTAVQPRSSIKRSPAPRIWTGSAAA